MSFLRRDRIVLRQSVGVSPPTNCAKKVWRTKNLGESGGVS